MTKVTKSGVLWMSHRRWWTALGMPAIYNPPFTHVDSLESDPRRDRWKWGGFFYKMEHHDLAA